MKKLILLTAAILTLVLALSLQGTANIKLQVENILGKMSLREKVAQMFIVPIYSNRPGWAIYRYLHRLKPGGIIILGNKLENTVVVKRMCDYIRKAHRKWRVPIPMFTSINQEGGNVNRLLRNVVLFPSAMAVGATGSTNIAYRVGEALGRQLLACGINMDYAPVLDVNYNDRNQVIGFRAFSDKQRKVIEFGKATMMGMKKAGLIAIAKHFPGHGRTKLDSHWFLPKVKASFNLLKKTDFNVFSRFSSRLMPGVMTAHVIYEKVDKLTATLSTKIIKNYFRKRAGYNGLIMTDDIYMAALSRRYSYQKIVRMAIQAGCDIISTSLSFGINKGLMRHLVNLVKKGTISVERINRSVRRILRVKLRYDMFKPKFLSYRKSMKICLSPEYKKLSNTVAEKAVTLVRDPAGIFPIRPTRSVLVVSYHRGFLWRMKQYLYKRKLARTVHTLPISFKVSYYQARLAYNRARRYDLVIYAGATTHDTKAVKLLAKLKKKKVVIVSFQNPYFVSRVKGNFSYIATFYHRFNSVLACARAIAGIIPFRGQCPVRIFR